MDFLWHTCVLLPLAQQKGEVLKLVTNACPKLQYANAQAPFKNKCWLPKPKLYERVLGLNVVKQHALLFERPNEALKPSCQEQGRHC